MNAVVEDTEGGKSGLEEAGGKWRSTFQNYRFLLYSKNNYDNYATVTTDFWSSIRECNQKFPYWQRVARTANGTALCHYVQLYRYFVSHSIEFCIHNPLCRFSTSNAKGKRTFRYRLSPETFGYTLVQLFLDISISRILAKTIP
jgi:hypothetical protein